MQDEDYQNTESMRTEISVFSDARSVTAVTITPSYERFEFEFEAWYLSQLQTGRNTMTNPEEHLSTKQDLHQNRKTKTRKTN